MQYYALVVFVVGLMVGAPHLLGVEGIPPVAAQISWVLVLLGIVLLTIHLVRRGPVREA